MSSIANLTSTPALPQLNTHPHGHKKGSHVASADDSGSNDSNTAAPVPVGSQQNLFGSLLQSLEQVIGVQLSATAPAAAATPASAAAATSQSANGPQSAGSKVNVLA